MAGSALSVIDEGVEPPGSGSVAAPGRGRRRPNAAGVAVERRPFDAGAQKVDAGFAPGADDVGEVPLERESGSAQERQQGQGQGERQWRGDSEITDVKSFPLSNSAVRETRWRQRRRRPLACVAAA